MRHRLIESSVPASIPVSWESKASVHGVTFHLLCSRAAIRILPTMLRFMLQRAKHEG